MVAGIPPVLPPGYISLFQAIDCVDPGALQKGTDRARKDPDRFLESLDWVAVAQQGIADVPQLVLDEISRRVRRRNAFGRIRDLCAWGTVPSVLLPDDFSWSHRIRIPPANWLDDRLSAELHDTGRTTIGDRPSRVSGWVMIDVAAFRAAMDVASPQPSIGTGGTGAGEAATEDFLGTSAGEAATKDFLIAEMKANPDTPKSNADLWREVHEVRKFNVSERGFKRAKADAIANTGATQWGKAGSKSGR
jgi:hypothetical protein